MLAAGNVSDIKAAPALIQRAERILYLLADKDYDVDQLQHSLHDAGAVSIILSHPNRKRTIRYEKVRYRGLRVIENAFCRLKNSRWVATDTTNSPPISSHAWRSPPL